MLCLLCSEDAGGVTSDEVTVDPMDKSRNGQRLCQLLELEAAEYEEILSVGTFCGRCLEELREVDIKLDPEVPYEVMDERRETVKRRLMNSWMKLQSEDVHADNYCSWQSVRLRILLDLGAVMEVVEDPVAISREQSDNNPFQADDYVYTFENFQEDVAAGLEMTMDTIREGIKSYAGEEEALNEGPLYLVADTKVGQDLSTDQDPVAESNNSFCNPEDSLHVRGITEEQTALKIIDGEGPVTQNKKSSLIQGKYSEETVVKFLPVLPRELTECSSNNSELMASPKILTSCNKFPSQEKICSQDERLTKVSDSFRLNKLETANTSLGANDPPVNEEISRGRKSKRKPLRPTKGIYSLKSPTRKEPAANVKSTNVLAEEIIKSQTVTSTSQFIPSNSVNNDTGNTLASSDSCIASCDIEIETPNSLMTSKKELANTSLLTPACEVYNSDQEEKSKQQSGNSSNQTQNSMIQNPLETFSMVFDKQVRTPRNFKKSVKVSNPNSKSNCHQINHPVKNTLAIKETMVESSLDSPPASPKEMLELPWNSSPDTMAEVQLTRRSIRRIHKNIRYSTDFEASEINSGRTRSLRGKREQENSKKAETSKRIKHSSPREISIQKGGNDTEMECSRVSEIQKQSTELKPSILNNSNAQRSTNEGPADVESKQKFKCQKKGCDRQFSTRDRRDNHFKRKHEGIRNLFSCNICNKTFPARTRLATHMQRHEKAGKTYPCSQCDKSFPTQKKLDFHLYQHSHNWGLYCDICNKGFPAGQEQRLANHKKIHDESRPRPFECSTCGRKFSSQQYLNIHQKNHPIQPGDDGLYKCMIETCQLTFKAVTSFREHQKTHTGELPFECEVCGKKFGYITGYKKHMISHTDEKHHVCHICGKQFKQKGNLNLHIERHSGIKPYKCTFPGCNYSFFDQYKLKNHADVHTGKRIFKCADCDKCFRTTTGLKSHHAAVHAKERKYKCHCGKTFSQKQYLQFHKTQHPELNLKRFTCEVCSKKFSEPSSLREHKRRFHTGETSFRCDKCDYTACFKSRMEKHLLTHSNPQFDCSKCGKQFRQANNLKRHLATVHLTKSK